jgi:hypothetical protein
LPQFSLPCSFKLHCVDRVDRVDHVDSPWPLAAASAHIVVGRHFAQHRPVPPTPPCYDNAPSSVPDALGALRTARVISFTVDDSGAGPEGAWRLPLEIFGGHHHLTAICSNDGCPADGTWDQLARLPNLRQLSVSNRLRWIEDQDSLSTLTMLHHLGLCNPWWPESGLPRSMSA